MDGGGVGIVIAHLPRSWSGGRRGRSVSMAVETKTREKGVGTAIYGERWEISSVSLYLIVFHELRTA